MNRIQCICGRRLLSVVLLAATVVVASSQSVSGVVRPESAQDDMEFLSEEQAAWYEGLKDVSADAFAGHHRIWEVNLYSVEELAMEAFDDVEIHNLTIGREGQSGSVFIKKEYSNIFAGLWKLEMYIPARGAGAPVYPNGPRYNQLEFVPAFKDVHTLESVVLPDAAKEIKAWSLSECWYLKEVRLPSCTSFIGDWVLSGSQALETVILPVPVPPLLDAYTFDGATGRARMTLVVPVGCADVYRNTAGWSDFGDIVEDESIVYDFNPSWLPLLPDGNFGSSHNSELHFRLLDSDAKTAMLVSDAYYIDRYEGNKPVIHADTQNRSYFPILTRSSAVVEREYALGEDGERYTITEIGPYTFSSYRQCDEVCIPSTVLRIHHGAFEYHPDVTNVYSKAIEPPLVDDDSVFGDKSELALYVPQGCGEAYAGAAVWRDFGSITEDPTLGSASVITINAESSDAPATYYGLDGRLLPDGAPAGGLCIERRADGSARLVGRR